MTTLHDQLMSRHGSAALDRVRAERLTSVIDGVEFEYDARVYRGEREVLPGMAQEVSLIKVMLPASHPPPDSGNGKIIVSDERGGVAAARTIREVFSRAGGEWEVWLQ